MLRRSHLALALLLLVVCLVYANSLANGFHFDDFHAVTDNPAVRSLANLKRIFTDTTAFSVLPANQTYRPLVTASLALDYALGRGYAPLWFHLSTLFWFLVLVSLLFLLFESLLNRVHTSAANEWIALVTAGWFGLHPVMAETVNYVIQRGDVYCTLGCVAGLFIFIQWPHLRRFGLYLFPSCWQCSPNRRPPCFPRSCCCIAFTLKKVAGLSCPGAGEASSPHCQRSL